MPVPSSFPAPAPRSASSQARLAGFSAMDLGGFATAAALERAGTAIRSRSTTSAWGRRTGRTGPDHRPPGRRQGGYPMTVAATTVNKVCLPA